MTRLLALIETTLTRRRLAQAHLNTVQEPHRSQPISPNLTGPACRIRETRTPSERLRP